MNNIQVDYLINGRYYRVLGSSYKGGEKLTCIVDCPMEGCKTTYGDVGVVDEEYGLVVFPNGEKFANKGDKFLKLRCYFDGMATKELIGYCDIHCETDRALFSREQVAQMIYLAGEPDTWDSPNVIVTCSVKWISLKEEMKALVALARERIKVY